MSSPEQTLRIIIGDVEISLPGDLPFQYSPRDSLAIDLSAGCRGTLRIKAVTGVRKSQSPQLPFFTAPKEKHLPATDPKLKIIPDSQAGQSGAEVSWFNQSPVRTQATCQPQKGQIQEESGHVSDEGTATSQKSASPDEDIANHEEELATPQEAMNVAADATGEPASIQPQTYSLAPKEGAQAQSEAIGNLIEANKSEATQDKTLQAAATEEVAPFDKEKVIPLSSNKETASDSANKVTLDGNKENTPAAANKQKKEPKRKSDGRSSYPSTGKRSGKKQKAILGQEASGMTFQWRVLSCKGEEGGPQERWGATLTAAENNKAWLFAGNSADDQLGDIWALDTAAAQWTKLSDNADQVKAWHQSHIMTTEQGKHLYAIGGERVTAGPASSIDEDDDVECLPDVCRFDEQAKLWMQLPISGAKLQRAGHSTTLLPDSRILLFGGIDADGKHRNDTHIIDLQHLNCFSLSGGIVRGAPPKPRAYHSATLVGKNIIVLGGIGARVWSLKEVYSLSIENWHWKEHTADVEGEAPTPRSGHSAVALPGDRFLLVFGGGIPDQNAFFGTVSLLDTFTWTWTVPTITGVERPRGRSGQGMALVQTSDGQYVIALNGGRTHEERLCKDTWILERTA